MECLADLESYEKRGKLKVERGLWGITGQARIAPFKWQSLPPVARRGWEMLRTEYVFLEANLGGWLPIMLNVTVSYTGG